MKTRDQRNANDASNDDGDKDTHVWSLCMVPYQTKRPRGARAASFPNPIFKPISARAGYRPNPCEGVKLATPPFNLKIDEAFVGRLSDFIGDLALRGWQGALTQTV
jgi:hypothetical protein